MNYPEHIYNTYEIVEKDICGEKHYGLVRVYKLFGWEFRRQLVVTEYLTGYGHIGDFGFSRKWFPDRRVIQSAIKNAHNYQEMVFRRKMTK